MKTRDKIIKKTEELLIQKGAKYTSLADIAKAVGISKGTLYYHYASKSELIYDIADSHMKEITEDLLSWTTKVAGTLSAEEIVLTVYKRILSEKNRGKLHLYLIQEAIFDNPELVKRFQDAFKEWKQMLIQGLKNLIKPEKDIEIISQLLLTSLTGSLVQTLMDVKDLPLLEMSKEILS